MSVWINVSAEISALLQLQKDFLARELDRREVCV